MERVYQEEWRKVEGFEAYEVSNYGNVRSIERKVLCSSGEVRHRKAVLLKPTSVLGYAIVTIYSNRKPNYRKIHRLVATAFLGNPEKLPVVNHINGNKLDNTVSNLEWCTPSHNSLHAVATGLTNSAKGEAHGRAKLTEIQVHEIRNLCNNGAVQAQIAKKFGVKPMIISNIVNRKRWRHI